MRLKAFHQASARGVLFVLDPIASADRWFLEVDAVLSPAGLTVWMVGSSPEAVERVERGGVSGVVLVGDRRRIDGLALLRIIRSIDADLPCWLVTKAPTRATLEAALALRAAGVMNHPPIAAELALAVQRVLRD